MSESGPRAIEKVFVREEYRRAHGEDIGELIYPGRAVEQYVERLERATNSMAMRGATIVVDFSSGVASLVASRVFGRLGVGAVVVEGFTKVFYPEASNTVVFVLMVLVLLIKPTGLTGRAA